MKKFKFELGQKVKDKFTDYEGIIMARIQYLTGCVQYHVLNQELDKDGDIRDWLSFDENRLKLVQKKAVKAKGAKGGPMPLGKSTNK